MSATPVLLARGLGEALNTFGKRRNGSPHEACLDARGDSHKKGAGTLVGG